MLPPVRPHLSDPHSGLGFLGLTVVDVLELLHGLSLPRRFASRRIPRPDSAAVLLTAFTPSGSPPFAHARVVEKYLEDYTDHFKIRHLLRLSTPVRKVTPPGKAGKWAVALEKTGEVEYFDKVVMATGINQVPVIPDIRGIEQFAGRCLHSRAYKR